MTASGDGKRESLILAYVIRAIAFEGFSLTMGLPMSSHIVSPCLRSILHIGRREAFISFSPLLSFGQVFPRSLAGQGPREKASQMQ
jgi:hypothetical protein